MYKKIIISIFLIIWLATLTSCTNNKTDTDIITETPEITIISDKRCWSECNTAPIISQLKQTSSLSSVEIKTIDYSEDEAKKILKETGIKYLPAVIFSNNWVGKEISKFLKPTSNNKYYLELWARFDPTVKMSEKWFKIVDKKVLENIKSTSYIQWNKNAKITWIEYSDPQCPFCIKLHNSGTPQDLEKKYKEKLNKIFITFPLGNSKKSLIVAEALECIWKEKWSEAYYSLKNSVFTKQKLDKRFLINESVKLGANKDTMTKCIKNNHFKEKIKKQQELWTKEFGVTGTPGNVLINNETGEYKLLGGAYPTADFIEVIDKLLK